MTRDEAVSRIQEGLGFRTDRAESIKARLEEARIALETGKTLPWFLIQEDQSLTLAQGADTVALPTGFIRPVADEDQALRYTSIDSDFPLYIPFKTLRDAQDAYADRDPGAPLVVVLRNTQLKFFPVADIEYALTWSYYKHSDALNAGNVSDHPWLTYAPDAIIGEAGYRMAVDLDDDKSAQKFKTMQLEGRTQLISEGVERDMVEGPLILGANN